MPNPTPLTPEELLSLLEQEQAALSNQLLGSMDQLSDTESLFLLFRECRRLLTTLTTAQRERDEAVKEGLRLTVELEQRNTEIRDLNLEIKGLYTKVHLLEMECEALRAGVEVLEETQVKAATSGEEG